MKRDTQTARMAVFACLFLKSYFPTESNSRQISSDGAAVARETITMAAQATRNAGSSSKSEAKRS